MKRIQRTLSAMFLCGGMILGGTVRAQVMNPKAVQGRENTKGVFVRDSAVAVDKVFQAKHMEDLREWDRAAEVYQDIIKNYADRMVPSDIDGENEIYQYGSVTPLVHEKLSRWSPDALAAYRARYESEAAALVESAHDDPAVLHRVMTWYFVTDAGKQSAMRLMDLYFERGEFSAVAWIGERLAALHPFLTREKPAVLFRAALANHLAGDNEKAQAQLKRLTEQFPQATATIRGAEVNLAEILAKELAGNETHLQEFSFDSWPIAFGSRDRARVPQISNYGGAKLFSVEVEKPNLRNVAPGSRTGLTTQFAADLRQGNMTGILPVLDRGELFFQDNANVYAVSAESGYPLAGWADTYPGERRGRFSISAWATPRSYQSTLTVTEDVVLAVMGQPDLVSMQLAQIAVAKETRLVCLDRRTGKERWTTMPRRFPDAHASLRGLDLIGSPLVAGDLVYVQARGGKGLQFEDSYVMAFDLANGQLRWGCYVASANSGQQFWRQGLGAIMGGNSSHLAYYNGRLYAQTNIGAVAALDAYDGTIVWLNIYPRDSESNRIMGFGWGRGGQRQINQRLEASVTSNSIQPWKQNPVIVSQGNVFVLPSDGTHVHIYNAGTGAEVKRIPTSAFGSAEVLLGVADDKLIIHNTRIVYCIDWQNYNPTKPQQSLLWQSTPMTGANQYDPSIMGRGFVTADSVLIPTVRRLVRLSLRGGKIEQNYPGLESDNWPDEEGPGNVLVTQDRLIIAGPTSANTMRVNVYTDLSLAIKKLEADIAAAPNDPAQRLRYADIMFAANKVDVAISKLDEAIGLLTGAAARDTDARDRIFNSAMGYAQKLGRDSTAQNADLITAVYDRAGAAAASPAQKVEFRLARARFAAQRTQFDVAVKFFQQILLDETLRAVPVSTVDGNTITAGNLARSEIGNAIRSASVAVYAPYEKAANDAVLAAARVRNPQQLQSIILSYPNSVAASQAMLLAADVYEASSNHKLATQVLRQAYFDQNPDRPSSPVERVRILEALARNYLRLPNGLDVAIARLNQAATASGGSRLTRPLILSDGRTIENMSLAEASQALKQLRTQSVVPSLPDVRLPTTGQGAPGQQLPSFRPEEAGSIISRVDKLIVPEPDRSRPDRLVTFTKDVGIRVFAVGNTTPLLTSDSIKETPLGAAWLDGNLVVWGETELAMLAPDAAQTLWASSLKAVPPIEVVNQGREDSRSPENDPLRAQRPNVVIGGNGQQFIIQGQQVIIRGGPGGLQIVGGIVQPDGPPRPPNEQISHVHVLFDRLLVGTTDGRLIAININGGKVLWQQRPGDNGFSHMVANDDFAAVRMPDESSMVSQLIVYDISTGQVLSRRTFGTTIAEANPLVNIALAPDGTLVYLTHRALYGKDLFEPGGLDRPSFQFGNKPGEVVNFQAATSPEHLQIFGDKIVVVSSDNAGSGVWVLSLRDGTRVKFGQTEAFMHLDLSSTNSPFMIRSGGSSLYVATAKEVRKLDMETGTQWGPSPHSFRTATALREMTVARGHLVLLTDLAGPGAGVNLNRQFTVRLLAFSRALDPKGVESGLCEHEREISTGTVMMVGWQIVDGGLYYLAGDSRLHFLRGARD